MPHDNYDIEINSELGSGTYGAAEKVTLRNRHGNACNKNGYAKKTLINHDGDPDLVSRFNREVKAQGDCLHKNVVQIFLCNLQADPPYFVMELAKESLHDLLSRGDLQKNKKIDILKMIVSGLSHIHKKGYLHRDIKPENILVFHDGTCKLSDFGLARGIKPKPGQFATKVGEFFGSAKYFDYDVFARGYSERSDLYSVGVLMEDLYFDGLDPIIIKCKHSQFEKRYDNADQLLTDILDLEDNV